MKTVLCPRCGAPSWNAALNPGEPCLRCKRQANPTPPEREEDPMVDPMDEAAAVAVSEATE